MGLVVGAGDDDQREVLDVVLELGVHSGKSDTAQHLAELVELGRLQRDGVTRFNLHGLSIVPDRPEAQPVVGLPFTGSVGAPGTHLRPASGTAVGHVPVRRVRSSGGRRRRTRRTSTACMTSPPSPMWARISNTMAASSPATITCSGRSSMRSASSRARPRTSPGRSVPTWVRRADGVLEDTLGSPQREEAALVVTGVRVDIRIDGGADLVRTGHEDLVGGRTGASSLPASQASIPRAMSQPSQYGTPVGRGGVLPPVAKG